MKRIFMLTCGFIVAFTVVLGLNGVAHTAVICSTGDVSGSIQCLDGIGGTENATGTILNASPGFFNITDWEKLSRQNIGGALEEEVDIDLVVTSVGNSGTYSFSSGVWSTYDNIMIVLKDGGVPDNTGLKWFAYLLDEGVSSGDWSYPGEKHDLSNLTVFGGGTPVPLPATLFLFGSGLVGLSGLRWKFKKS
jgi:hypothetical protein